MNQLVDAVKAGDFGAVHTLLGSGSDVNSTDDDSRSALSWAATSGKSELVHLIINFGADVELADRNDRTPLFWATFNSDSAVARALVDSGASVSARDHWGRTPLHWAAWMGSLALVDLLLERSTDVNVADSLHSQTPLLLATAEGHEPVVRSLIISGADVNLPGKYSVTALGIARSRGYAAIACLLLEAGATEPAVPPNSAAAAQGENSDAKLIEYLNKRRANQGRVDGD